MTHDMTGFVAIFIKAIVSRILAWSILCPLCCSSQRPPDLNSKGCDASPRLNQAFWLTCRWQTSVDGMRLWVYNNKIPIYPIFYLLKGDYSFIGIDTKDSKPTR